MPSAVISKFSGSRIQTGNLLFSIWNHQNTRISQSWAVPIVLRCSKQCVSSKITVSYSLGICNILCITQKSQLAFRCICFLRLITCIRAAKCFIPPTVRNYVICHFSRHNFIKILFCIKFVCNAFFIFRIINKSYFFIIICVPINRFITKTWGKCNKLTVIFAGINTF